MDLGHATGPYKESLYLRNSFLHEQRFFRSQAISRVLLYRARIGLRGEGKLLVEQTKVRERRGRKKVSIVWKVRFACSTFAAVNNESCNTPPDRSLVHIRAIEK